MRIKCEFKTDKIPLGYRMMFVSLIKNSIAKVNKQYFAELYNFQDKKNKKIKNFSFGVFLKDFKIEEDEIQIKDKVIFTLTTPDYNFGINLYNGLLKINNYKYQSYELTKLKVSLVKEKFINSGEVVFKTLSPLIIKNKSNEFIDINNEDYEKELNYILDISLKSFRGYGLKEPISFHPVLMKKAVVKEKIADFTEITSKRYMMLNGYTGIFKLIGDTEDLNLIQKLGAGFRRSEGFGMLEMV